MVFSGMFSGKVAVVTGGASGIGLGISRQLIKAGARTVIADIEGPVAKKVAAEIGATAIQCDVTDARSVQALAAASVEAMGSVDLVFNNAGIAFCGPLRDVSLDDWHWMLNVNLFGVIHGVRAFLPVLEANPNGGRIINTGSLGSFAILPDLGAYCVSKFGVVALTEALAAELKMANSKVQASVICPGRVATNIGKSSRNRPKNLGVTSFQELEVEVDVDSADGAWMAPDLAGHIILEALCRNEFYIFTHADDMLNAAMERFEVIRGAVGRAKERLT